MKKERATVDLRAADCCFNCSGFARPHAPGVVNGHCVRVKGGVHPANVCDEFEPAIEDDDDDNNNPRAHEEHIGVSA